MDCCGHQKEIAALRGSARRNPAAGAGLVVGSMAMIGIPFFSGFVSKISFAMASFHDLDRTVLVLGLSLIHIFSMRMSNTRMSQNPFCL